MAREKVVRLAALSLLVVLLSANLQSCGLLDVFARAFSHICEVPLVVTTTIDKDDGACLPDDCSLREAVVTANDCPNRQTIQVPDGTYLLTLTGTGADDEAFGDLDISDDVTIEATGGEVIIDGNHSDRVFEILTGVGSTSPVEIDGVMIRNGQGTPSGGGILIDAGAGLNLADVVMHNNWAGGGLSSPGSGGAIHDSGSLSTSNVEISHNHAYGEGGGIFVQVGSSFNAESTMIHDNQTLNGYSGGGVYNRGDVVFDGELQDNTTQGFGGGVFNGGSFQMSGGQISNNTARIGGGGLANFHDLTLTGAEVLDNTAPLGAGLYSAAGVPSSPASGTLTNVTLQGNMALLSGGGIWNGSGSVLNMTNDNMNTNQAVSGVGMFNLGEAHLTDSTLRGNLIRVLPGYNGEGGGIYNEGTMSVDRSTIAENQGSTFDLVATDGSGIFNNGSLTLHNVTISGNVSLGETGAALVTLGTTALNAFHVTIADNSHYGIQGLGGGGVNLANSIVAGNGLDGCGRGHEVVSSGGNVFDDDSCAPLVPLGDIIVPDVMLQPLANYGGPTDTHALDPSSPAIDVALDDKCEPTDQRGFPRPYGDACDAGAYEAEEVSPTSGRLPEGIPLGPTTCRFGPRPIYPPIAYLTQGQTVQLLHRNDDASWLEIQSLDGKVGPCWVDTTLLAIPPAFDPTTLQPGIIPPEPTATPSPEPENGGGLQTGCRVYDTTTKDPNDMVCVHRPCTPNDQPGGTCHY